MCVGSQHVPVAMQDNEAGLRKELAGARPYAHGGTMGGVQAQARGRVAAARQGGTRQAASGWATCAADGRNCACRETRRVGASRLKGGGGGCGPDEAVASHMASYMASHTATTRPLSRRRWPQCPRRSIFSRSGPRTSSPGRPGARRCDRRAGDLRPIPSGPPMDLQCDVRIAWPATTAWTAAV